MQLLIYLSIYLSTYLSIHPFIHPSIHPIHPSIFTFIFIIIIYIGLILSYPFFLFSYFSYRIYLSIYIYKDISIFNCTLCIYQHIQVPPSTSLPAGAARTWDWPHEEQGDEHQENLRDDGHRWPMAIKNRGNEWGLNRPWSWIQSGWWLSHPSEKYESQWEGLSHIWNGK